MSKGHSLQDPFLNMLRKQRIPVSVYLVSGIKLQGQIESFDQFVILLKNAVSQMVYKHAISTVVPSRAVKLPMQQGSMQQGSMQQGPMSSSQGDYDDDHDDHHDDDDDDDRGIEPGNAV